MKIVKLIDAYFEEALAVVFFLIILAIGMEQVFSRYVLEFVRPWSEEMMRILFVALSLVSFSLCAKHKQHVKVEILQIVLPKGVGRALEFLASIAFLVFTLLVAKYSYDIAVLQYESGQTTAAMDLPTWSYFAFGPFMFVVMALRIVQKDIVPFFCRAQERSGGAV
ncbi:MAG TPA: hypothetical protein DIC53_08705 [Synergistaceae bacterium]|nr:hypothetical protein [Synergistaceae bacterium]